MTSHGVVRDTEARQPVWKQPVSSHGANERAPREAGPSRRSSIPAGELARRGPDVVRAVHVDQALVGVELDPRHPLPREVVAADVAPLADRPDLARVEELLRAPVG